MNLILIKNRLLSALVLVAIVSTEIFSAPVAYALTTISEASKPGSFEETYDLITVIVDSELDKDLGSYAGLKNKYPDNLKENTLGERIVRYSEDLQSSNEYTDVHVLIFDKNKETTYDLANALENLYFNGNDENKNRLAGVVLVGNIPLPVVNKNGEKFVSMYPYTDFESKTYKYDLKTLNFEYDQNITFPKPEIWGGVIKADTVGVKGQEELANFFDKNHLYYSGVSEYANFDKKIFYGDLVHEEESVNTDVYPAYLKYLKYWEDLAYMRYNKYWAKDLSKSANDQAGVKEADDLMKDLPDVMSKQIIDQFLLPYFKIISSYIGQAHDFIDGTGRYGSKDADILGVLISAKDEYAKTYLRYLNDAIEKKINEIVYKIEDTISLVTNVNLTGSFTEEGGEIKPFVLTKNNLTYLGANIGYGYNLSNYTGGANGSHYLNGINYDLLKNAKQCSVYLGSYTPGSKDYSILTRAIRSDDPSTGIPVHTFGVNTRILNENEAKKLTNGNALTGAVIESNADYGIPAFYPNPNFATGDYKNYFFGPLQEGDVITKINGKEINSTYTLDQAAEASYNAVKSVVTEGNVTLFSKIDQLGYKLLIPSSDDLKAGKVQTAAGNISVEFFHNGEKKSKNFTFSVTKSQDLYNPTYYAPYGSPRIYVLLSDLGFEGTPSSAIFDAGTMGAIFTLYDNMSSNDLAAGCTITNASSNTAGAPKNNDRCFYPIAKMPILDPAGTTGLKNINLPYEDNEPHFKPNTQLMFPESFSGKYSDHMNMFQFPSGFGLNNLDEIYFNSCFTPYPTLELTNTYSESSGNELKFGLYYNLLNSFKKFREDLIKKVKTDIAPGKNETWLGIDKLDASQIVANNSNNQNVTLKDFSDRYGFFDGVDNNKNGFADFKLEDLLKEDGKPGQDGVFETTTYDFDEADLKYGIPSNRLSEISRKMLSKNISYTIPRKAPWNKYNADITLNVSVSNYKNKDGTDKKLSSAILHNEPTNYTIAAQVNANSSDLPIDNPRYVAFLSTPPDKALNGEPQKIYYPNVFDAENIAQIKVKLDAVAWQIAQTPGAEVLTGEKKDLVSIHDEVYNKYLAPIVDAQKDDSPDGFILNAASSTKIYDALVWRTLGMDEKHDYIFSRYFNPDKDAYVGDSANGYEAAYLLLNGEKDSFKTNFNSKGSLIKTADGGVEIGTASLPGDTAKAGGGSVNTGGSGGTEPEEESDEAQYEFVDLKDFIKDVDKFLEYFTAKPNFKPVCVNPNPIDLGGEEKKPGEKTLPEDKGLADALGGNAIELLETASVEMIPDSTVLASNGQSKTKMNVVFRDKNGKKVNTYARATIKIDSKISVDPKTDEFQNIDGIQVSSFEGALSFEIYSKNSVGSSTISAYLIDDNFEKINGSETAKIINIFDNLSLTLAAKGNSIKAQLTRNGEVVTGFSGPIEFKVVKSTLGQFVPAAPIKMTNGNAIDAVFQPYKTAFGDVEIYVNVPGFASNSITINILKTKEQVKKEEAKKDTSYKYNYEKVAGFNTKSLYVSLLGGDFGNPEKEKNIAQAFLQNGYVQAVSADTQIPSITKKLVSIDGYGKVDVLSEDIVATILPVSDSSQNAQKISFENINTKEALAEASIKMVDNIKVDVKMLSEDTDYKVEQKDDGFYLTQGLETKVKISNSGKISINDNSFALRLPEEDDEFETYEFSLVITKDSQDFALVSFNGKKEIKFTLLSGDPKYDFASFFSRASTTEPKGLYLLDNDSTAAPFSENAGAGFKYQDKNMLYFAAGNSVGESSVPYGSEYGIIYGDPNVRVGKSWLTGLVSKFSGYTKDIGTPLFQGEDEVSKLINFDFNGDGKDDILLAYEDGHVRLLEYEGGHKKFRDKGYILNVAGGIYSAAKIDSNNDGYDDIVVGTKEPCKATEKCVSLFVNNATTLERKTLNLNIDGKVYEMKGYDMNKDGCDDLVTTDASANVRVFYNKNDGKSCLGLETNYGNSFNFGYGINSDTDMKNNLFVYLPGMENLKAVLPKQGQNFAEPDFIEFGTLGNDQFKTNNKQYNLKHISKIPELTSSTKTAIDVNGNNVASLDKIEFTITLKNNSGSNLSGVILSDLTPATMTIHGDSLKCVDANCSDKLEWVDSGMSMRDRVIKNISIPANGKRTIKYSATVDMIPSINFDLGYDFGGYEKDKYPDIRVRPSINPKGDLIYLYSTGISDSYVNYQKKVIPSTGNGLSDEYDKEFKKNGLPSPKDLVSGIGASGVPNGVKQSLTGMVNAMSKDKDGSGCPDDWESFKKTAVNLGDAIYDGANTISNFKCSGGGCLPIPYNYAFLVPHDPMPGYAAVAFGTPNPPYVGFFYPSNLVSSVRLYLSPTLTMGLGTAVCVGPGGSGACYATAIPPSLLGGCPDFLGSINDAIAKAKDVVTDPDIGTATVTSDGEASTGTDAISTGGSYSSDKMPISVASKVNVRIPGFPGVITNWLDKETDEIYNKLLDFPDIYLIIPDFGSLGGKFAAAGKNLKKIKSINDFLRAINSIPFVQIEGKEILIKVPAITQAEIEKWKRQASLWLDYEENEIKRVQEYWKCDENNYRKTLCDKVTVNLQGYITSIKTLMDKLDKIAKLPSEILKLRSLETKYATQIICYLDAIMQFTGGYIKRQNKIAESWTKAVEDAIKTFKDWQTILKISIDYEKSCNDCNKSDRFSKLGMLLNLFVSIPDPPVIPLPKWPDIVFDISKIKTGVHIVWPDVVFKPESINLPNLPTITLPELIPEDYTLDISKAFGVDAKFDIPDWIKNFPEFVMPNFPDLPNLAFPNLPDLPRPPKIPKLPNEVMDVVTSLKKVIKILCLLKKGLLPISEGDLATQIETLTQPSAQSILPVLKQFSLQMPAIQYDYVDQIKVEAKLNFGIDTSFIYYFAKLGADKINEQSAKLIKGINEYTGLPFQAAINNLVKQITDGAVKKAQEGIKEGVSEVQDVTEKTIDEVEKAVDKKQTSIPEIFVQLNSELSKFSSDIDKYVSTLDIDEDYPETFYLTATESILDKNDPILNKKLSDIKDFDSSSFSNYPEMQKMSAIRNSMLAYANGMTKSNDVLSEIKDYDEFMKFIAEDTDSNDILAENTLQKIDISSSTKQEIKGSLFSDDVKERMIAYEPTAGDIKNTAVAGNESAAVGAPKGFYVVADGKNESVLTYTSELGGAMNTLFIDADSDTDKDIVFSMGGDVYMKINHKETPKSEKGDIYVSASNSAVSDYMTKDGVNFTSYYPMYEAPLCSDKEPPLPAISKTTFNVPIFQSVLIDASNSIDIDGGVAEYYVEMLPFENVQKNVTQFPKLIWSDVNLAVDENGDGNKTNDKSNPKFNIGPFMNEGDLGMHYAVLNVLDTSGNSSSQKIIINVFAPKISLDQPLERTPVASGKVDPALANIPFSLMRERYAYRAIGGNLSLVPKLEKIKTPTSEKDGKYKTAADGSYVINDFSTDDTILIEDENGKVIAKINPKTGNIGELADGYSIKINTSNKSSDAPTSITIVDKNGYIEATVYIVGDTNTDINSSNSFGTNVIDLNPNDGIDIKVLPSDSKFNPGGATIVDEKNNILFGAIEPSGNITILDNRLKAIKKANDYTKDPLVINLTVDDKIIAEVHVNTSISAKIVGAKDVPVAQPSNPTTLSKSANGFVSPFADFGNLSSDLKKVANDLYEKDIIEGVQSEDGIYLKPEDMVTRSQFVKILLKMLCIEPRPEAYKAYSPNEANGGFSDIQFKNPIDWFYPYIKESALRALIDGYRGETYQNNLHPFKPDNTINLAEASKIILSALQMQNIINIDKVQIGTPWYVNFIQAAQNLTKYMSKDKAVKNNFIITADEAKAPEKPMTRAELFILAGRVLNIYNCFENKPVKKDSDGGGTDDSTELKNGTDVFDPNDDKTPVIPSKFTQKESFPGIYVVPGECNTCPCKSTISNSSMILPTDRFFTIISNKDDSYIFSKSNVIDVVK